METRYLEMGDGDEGSEKWDVGDGNGWRRRGDGGGM